MRDQLLPAARSTLVLAVLTGLLFPLAVTGIAQLFFPGQANGSLIRAADGHVVGSSLIGQPFDQPGYFHPRPSAAGSGYAGEASGGTNLGPTSATLILGTPDQTQTGGKAAFAGVAQLAAVYRKTNGLADDTKVPVDAVTRSGSGLDPHISIANALLQAPRVARARGWPLAWVQELVHRHTTDRSLGFLGEPGVNVLQLNLALDQPITR